jgi:hypothetical protein
MRKQIYIFILLSAFCVSKVKAQTDTIAPDIHLLGGKCIAVCVGTQYADSGYYLADTLDNTADLVITVEGSFVTQGTQATGVYKLRYKAADKAGNIGFSEWRFINVRDSSQLPNCQPIALNCGNLDTIPPVITLVGNPYPYICRCIPYIDEGFSVSDNVDSVKDIKTDTSGTFKSADSAGLFTLRYKATDRAGNFSYSEWRYIYPRSWNEYPCTKYEYDPCGRLGVKEYAAEFNINLFPNPAQNELFVETNQFINTISIYNISGQKVFETVIKQNLNLPYKIDTKHFPAGIYMVQLKNALGIETRKIEIQR